MLFFFLRYIIGIFLYWAKIFFFLRDFNIYFASKIKKKKKEKNKKIKLNNGVK